MQSAVVMFPRKLPRPALPSARRSSRSPRSAVRDDITILRTIELDHASIAKALRISPEDARALSPRTTKQDMPRRLKRHAIDALLRGRHAHLGGKTVPLRAKNLLKIASAYTSLEELLAELGVGSVTATEIQLWLEERGAGLRNEDAKIS
jgi:hypothetical protein